MLLWHSLGTPLLSTETLIVEDGCGVIFAVRGAEGWLKSRPLYEALEGLEFYLPSEFAGVHENQ